MDKTVNGLRAAAALMLLSVVFDLLPLRWWRTHLALVELVDAIVADRADGRGRA